MLSIHAVFPDRMARCVNIGDCTPNDGLPCTGHPGASHQGLCGIDFDYLTLGSTNATQYLGQEVLEVMPIWIGGRSLTAELDLSLFDWERNFAFWENIYSAFPKSKAWIDVRIFEYMHPLILQHHGTTRGELFVEHVKPDSPMHYRHDTHIHWSLYPMYDYDVINWGL